MLGVVLVVGSQSRALRHDGALRATALGLFLLTLSVPACGGGAHTGETPGADGLVEEARLRLRGAWKLDSFISEQPMSDALNDVLGPETQIRFSDAQVSLSGSTAALDYTLTDPNGDGATIYLHTEGGIAYEVVGQFSGEVINFRSMTPPWRGTGVLVRP